ncbi:UPF0175 family protein [Larkinella sp. VNQ87]|uniref:UPF0175 family protein n=1 Tax=Larkinella sp. VNQ87 TaxID=3400921 RepID=UPI003C10CCF7
MKTLTIQLPDSINEHDVLMQLAGVLFEKGILSSGQATEMVGISKAEFLESIGRYGISIFGETPEDIENL